MCTFRARDSGIGAAPEEKNEVRVDMTGTTMGDDAQKQCRCCSLPQDLAGEASRKSSVSIASGMPRKAVDRHDIIQFSRIVHRTASTSGHARVPFVNTDTSWNSPIEPEGCYTVGGGVQCCLTFGRCA